MGQIMHSEVGRSGLAITGVMMLVDGDVPAVPDYADDWLA